MTLRKILCPIDFSAGSQHAMQVAARLAKRAGAELILTHSWYVPPLAFADEAPFPADTIQRMIEDEERNLAAATREVTGLGVERVTSRFLTGAPADRIAEAAGDDREIDLIVMGTHGRTGLRRVLLGSVAEKVVRHAPCSVLAVRETSAATPFRHVLCPIDFSETSRLAVELAAQLVDPDGDGLELLHVLELPISASGEPLAPDFLVDLDRRAAARLDEWAAEIQNSAKLRVTTRSRIGSPAGQALAVLDDDATLDLVVMGSHGRTGVGRILFGSVAEKLVRHARCPVLVARPRAA